MAINVNTVYQRVLRIANKEQRGYITPNEFNQIALIAQMDIFEQYFHDLSKYSRMSSAQENYADPTYMIYEKLQPFEVSVDYQPTYSASNSFGAFGIPEDCYRLSNVYIRKVDATGPGGLAFNQLHKLIPCDRVSSRELNLIRNGHPLLQPHANRPVYTRHGNEIYVYVQNEEGTTAAPNASYDASQFDNRTVSRTTDVNIDFYRKPATPIWGSLITNGVALYNVSNSTSFELHDSEFVNLINRILTLAGIMIKDPSLHNVMAQEEIKNIQQEKA